MIQQGTVQQFWWCGQATNPQNPSQDTDTILYAFIDTATHMASSPVVVLAESPNTWDSAYTCNPKVVRGTFVNPVGDGQTYTYVMYYVGTASIQGIDNSIGAAFSTDGIHWVKYPDPLIGSTSHTGYGVAQPAVYNVDHKAAILMFYEDTTPTNRHVEATSTDGIHFTVQGTLTTNGLDPNNPEASWGDMAQDSATKSWYAVFNLPLREPSTTGGKMEYGQMGVQLYRIDDSSLLTGATPWRQLKTFDTNLTGYECTFIPSFLRDPYGDVHIGPYPTIQLFPSISNPQPAWDASAADAGSSCRIATWDIGSAIWSPTEGLLALNRYANSKMHEVTTGWVDPNGGFRLQSVLGHLYEAPRNGATQPFYGCKSGSTDYFVSTDSGCEGSRILGLTGYGYFQPTAGQSLVPLYRCSTGHDHFVSTDPHCEGENTEALLGYALP